MTQEEKSETKEKIIETAGELFSKFGFQGTSVREIASQSGVNVAAISYHFGHKHNLYWAIINRKQKWLEEGIGQLAEDCNRIEDLCIATYNFLMTDKDAVRSTFKMMLTDGVPEPEGEIAEEVCNTVGPPGGEHFIAVLRKELPAEVSQQVIVWTMKSIFSSLFHFALLCTCSKVELVREKMPDMDEAGIEKQLRILSRAVVAYAKAHPQELE